VVATVTGARQFFVDRATVKVLTHTIYPTYGTQLGTAHMQVTAVNKGQRPAVITHMTVELPDKRSLALFSSAPSRPLPAKLEQPSRPPRDAALNGKPVGIIGASPGLVSGSGNQTFGMGKMGQNPPFLTGATFA